jgi:SNF2 family DNA or RNA helicase
LGKTITVLALIASNPVPPETVSLPSSVPSRRCNIQLIGALTFSRPQKFVSRLSEAQLGGQLAFDCPATLVVCPSHLVNQWRNEISKHTSPPLRLVASQLLASVLCSSCPCAIACRALHVITKPVHEKLSYRDIMNVRACCLLIVSPW